MDGLIIKKNWLDKIYQWKWIEVRGCNCKSHIGKDIALIESGSMLITGITNIIHTFQPRSKKHFWELRAIHGIVDIKNVTYKNIWFWAFGKRYKLSNPIPYKHPQGAVAWVKDVI